MGITGAKNSTPTAALEIILNIWPAHIRAQVEAQKTALRLVNLNLWGKNVPNVGHSEIWFKMVK